MPRLHRSARAIVLALGLATLAGRADARWLPEDALLCAAARAERAPRGAPSLPAFHPRVAVAVVDRLTRRSSTDLHTLDLRKAEAFCAPVGLDDAAPTSPSPGLEAYGARRTPRKPAPPPLPVVSERIDAGFETVALRIGGIAALRVPTLATGTVGDLTPDRDHFACYGVRHQRGARVRRGVLRVEVGTAAGRRTVELRKPVELCVPASVRGENADAPKHPLDLLCYDARLVRAAAEPPVFPELLATRNVFGPEVLRLGSPHLLCVPAVRSAVVAPAATALDQPVASDAATWAAP